ncbi:hypothetical protein RSAG8_06018, partial [Rhizoctonia solani AG-8 WAC10335]
MCCVTEDDRVRLRPKNVAGTRRLEKLNIRWGLGQKCQWVLWYINCCWLFRWL